VLPNSLLAAGDVDTSFNTSAGLLGFVFTFATQPDGKILLGGMFDNVNGIPRNSLARLNADGSLDANFNPDGLDDGFVLSLATQSDGKILVGGLFSSVNGFRRNNLARLNADGSMDETFNPGANERVIALAAQPDGKIVVGGRFTSIGGASRNRLARLNADGSPDSAFNTGTAANSQVNALALQPDNKILIGGNFTTFNGVARNRLTRLNADGSLDSTFNVGTGASGGIFSLLLQPDGKAVLGGDFTTFNGSPRNSLTRVNADGSVDSSFLPATSSGGVRDIQLQTDGKIVIGGFLFFPNTFDKAIARLNADGSLDTAFNLGSTSFNSSEAFGMVLQPNGKILVGGQFIHFNNVARNNLARLNNDGSLDAAFTTGTDAHSEIKTLAVQPDGRILMGGNFPSLNNLNGQFGLARIAANGNTDSTFFAGPFGGSFAVNALALKDGNIVIGGDFTALGDKFIPRGRVARLTANGDVDMTFNPNPGPNTPVLALAVQPDNKVIIAGAFTAVQFTSRSGIARLNANGGLDTTFNPGSGANGQVSAVALQPDGKVLIGGAFTSFNGLPRSGVARLNADGSLDESFATGSGFNNTVNALALQPDGKILIGGAFTSYNGATRNRLARLNADGSLDLSFSGDGANKSVHALALQPDGKIIVGGNFTSFNNIAANRIARLNINGSLDTAFNTGAGANARISSVALQPDGNILIGGVFGQVNGTPHNSIARLLGDGLTPTPTPTPIPSTVQFTQATAINESFGKRTITVSRSGGAEVAASVDYATQDSFAFTPCNAAGSVANQRCDYIPARGTLTFGPNETIKSFDVLVIDDAYSETSENIQLVLSNPINTNLGSLSAQTLVITDNDTTAGANRIFAAHLDSSQEAPANTSTATGLGNVTLNAAENQITVNMTFTGLSSAQSAAHIHGPAHVGANAPVLFNLGTGTITNATFAVTPAQVAQMRAGLFYFNIHTANFPNGEIRGQIASQPLENARFFVRQQYADFLSREPDAAGFDFWTGQIVTTCGADLACTRQRRVDVSNAFFFEQEFQQTGAYVYRLYRAAYGNTQPFPNPQSATLPNYEVFVNDRARVVGGSGLAASQLALATAFAGRAEFTARYPASQTAAQFVDAVLSNIQATTGANLTSQRDALVALHGAGGRGAVMYRLAEDNQAGNPINNRAFIDAEYNRAFVITQYYGYLRRDADFAGFNFWLGVVNQFPLRSPTGQNGMVCAFITSQEYQERFSAGVTRTNQECP
jgi:uncharacterized delta-60 repeat protein